MNQTSRDYLANNSGDSSFIRALLANENSLEYEIQSIEKIISKSSEKSIDAIEDDLKLGISIVIPSYLGEGRLQDLLSALKGQSLDYDRFEAIFVLNGPKDGSGDLIEGFSKANPDLQIRYFYIVPANAGAARNLGISIAQFKYITFVDDDDQLQQDFLKSAFELAEDNAIAINPIINVTNGEEVDSSNSINKRIVERLGRSIRLREVPWILGFNACKTFPTKMARNYAYRTTLRSGEDLVYFANLLSMPNLIVKFPISTVDNAYIRHMRENSISRQKLTFDFSVEQRLACMKALEDTPVDSGAIDARAMLGKAQAGFVIRYLSANPNDTERVVEAVNRFRVANFPWREVNSGQAKKLVLSYCFAPYNDSAGIVAAKVVASEREIVDVVSCNMRGVRYTDDDLKLISDRWIDSEVVVDAQPSFAGWEAITDFATKALSEVEKLVAIKGEYESLYSRALWIGSHVAALLYKLRYPNVRWSAEFSDPLRFDVEGLPRKGAVVDNAVSGLIQRSLARSGVDFPEVETVFDLVEFGTFLLADELIFTNDNQCEYMLSFHSPKVRELVLEKANIRRHPSPESHVYDIVDATYRIPPNVLNIAYFGSFYQNRSMAEVLVAIANLPSELKSRVRLHVFSNRQAELEEECLRLGIRHLVYSNNFLRYLKFLATAKLFDVLLVNDVVHNEIMGVNPFLPSKYSDYAGAGVPIWGLVEDGSPLSEMELSYRSLAGNAPSIRNTLISIIESFDGRVV